MSATTVDGATKGAGQDPKSDILHFGDGHRRFSPKKLAMLLLLILPLLAAVVFMWAMYDPSKSLRSVDLAVVNNDAGINQDGQQANFGESVVEGLLGRDYLSFTQVSAEEAATGLADGKYLFTVTIPENFSKDVATLMNDEPTKPEIQFQFNDFNGTNASVLTGALVPQIKTSVSSSISESYAERLIGGVNQLGDGIKNAAAGSQQLDDGAGKLNDGLGQSYDGTVRLNDGAVQLNDGAIQLSDGTSQLKDGTAELKDGTVRLTDGTSRLVDGTTQLSDGAATLVDGTYQLGDGATQINAGVTKLTDIALPPLQQAQQYVSQLQGVAPALRAIGMNEQADKLEGLLTQLDASNPQNLVDQLGALKDGTGTLAYMLSDPNSEYLGGILRLQDGINQAHDGAQQLADGATQLNDGATRLSDGATQLDDGATRLVDGSGQLRDGTGQLLDGQTQLKDGAGQLKDGTHELSTKLGEGAEAAPSIPNVDASSNQVAVPINYVETNSAPVQYVVDRKDPTVKALSSGASVLFVLVFGFLLMAVAAMSIPHVFGTNRRTAFVGPTLKSFAGLVAVGLIILAILAGGASLVGWSPASKAGIVLAFLGMAGAAAAMNQMLRAVFGRLTGGVAMLALFALGMFSFGGVWPLATVPKIFQFLHPLTPMAYAHDTFVRATQGNLDGTYVTGIIALALFTLIPLGITLLVRANRVRKVRQEFEAAQSASGNGGTPAKESVDA